MQRFVPAGSPRAKRRSPPIVHACDRASTCILLVHPNIKVVVSLQHAKTIVTKYHWGFKGQGPCVPPVGTITEPKPAPYQVNCDAWVMEAKSSDLGSQKKIDRKNCIVQKLHRANNARIAPPTAFRLQAQKLHLTYKGHLDMALWQSLFYAKWGIPKRFSFVHEESDNTTAYYWAAPIRLVGRVHAE